MTKMWTKIFLSLLKLVLVVQLLSVDSASGIYSRHQDGSVGSAYPADQRSPGNKRPVNPQLYKYLKGYYQNNKKFNTQNRKHQSFRNKYRPSNKLRSPSLNNPKKFGKTYLQPKSGLQSGQYNFAQSRDYLQKLRKLADLLKARVAARAARQQNKNQGAPPVQPPPQPYRPPPRTPSYQPPAIPKQPVQPAPKPIQQTYTPQRAPQPRPVVPQTSYRAPAPNLVQRSYNQVQQPQPKRPSTQNFGIAAPKQQSAAVSYQSLGLPGTGYRAVQPQPVVTAPPTTQKPKANSETLVKLLRASYASLIPLLLNQAKMTSYGVQTIPLYGSNPYRVFGPMTYGPLPKPNAAQMSLKYNPQSFSGTQTHPFSSGGYSSYSGYGNSGATAVRVPAARGSGSGYSNTGSTGYGGAASFSADVTCGPISGTFCQGRAAGHYSHPASNHCFVQCDHVGQGQPKSCSPGTTWKELGPEPALFNYCS